MRDKKTERRNLQAALRNLEPYDGKFVRRLNEETREKLREAIQEYGVPSNVQQYSNGNAPYIDLSGLRQQIQDLEESIHRLDLLDTCPELEEYMELLDRMAELEKKMDHDTGIIGAAPTAHKEKLIRGHVVWDG